VQTPVIEGFTAPGFEPVRDAFTQNFTARGEVGAALCVYLHGQPVVNLAGGTASPARADMAVPFRTTTLVPVFSISKAMVAIAALMLAERGLIGLDAPVARYWPQFALAGKESVIVRWLLTHQAGLAAIDEPMTYAEFLRWDPVITRLERQAPNWTPGTAFGYHSLTFGHLIGELIRRVTGLSAGQFINREIAAPLGVEFFIGMPPARLGEVAPVLPPPGPAAGLRFEPGSLPYRAQAFMHPPVTPASLNDPALLTAEIPAANGVSTAAAIARIFAALIGEVGGLRLISPQTMDQARAEHYRGPDLIETGSSQRATGLGFLLPSPDRPFAGPGSFGHSGLGGSRAWALPERGLACGYVVNRLTSDSPDPREMCITQAVLACTPHTTRAGTADARGSGTGSARPG
jgi:CubicO group peptidase (beta-lactamase class C family)